MDSNFEAVWQKILAHEGDTFHIARGGEFTYKAFPNYIISSRAKTRNLTKSNFEKAYQMMDVLTPTQFGKTIQGSSYVKAILKDPRIR